MFWQVPERSVIVRMTEQEWADYRRDGFIIRRGVFGAEDLEALRIASEEVIAQLVAHRTGRRMPAGAYTFELEATAETMIKWEGDTDVVHGIEPFVHLHPTFQKYADDPRFVELAKDLCGSEKLNYKRARAGGPVVLHQDHPYWVDSADDIDHLVTFMLLLDDSHMGNGCLEAIPGSHTWGVQKGKDIEGFGQFEMDEARADMSLLQPVPLAAGDFIAFGADLVHRSQPNRSETDRRAFLYTYQPAGYRTMLEGLRSWTRPKS